ncbi:MAG TPA: endonuclease/exonuclease/phosphatase family protein [Candidatus Limnocylindria bacterium]|nr:endonuclease/exonuclease/phosphatase family protein [Candidatus Limnocylindria bacterium]
MSRPRLCVLLLAAACAALALPGAAQAEQLLRGRRFTVADPAPADPSQRTLRATARQVGAAPLDGNPTLPTGFGGAVVEIVASGATPSWQLVSLPAGTAADGTPFWTALRTGGYRYRDRDGAQGPVRSLVVKRTARGTMRMKLAADGAALAVTPPAPGTDAQLALTLSQGDRLCVQYGPESRLRNDGAARFTAARPVALGCGTRPETTGEFVALSYNVAGLPEGISGSHPATNTAIISPLLNAYDLVLVQESWQTPDPNPLAPLRVYHEILAAGALHPYKTVSAPLPLGTDPRRPTALVSDGLNAFSRFPFTHLAREMWNGCWESAADCLSQKGFMMVRMTVAPGVTIDVYDLHMEAGGAPEDDVLRDEGVTQLATFINAVSAGRPVIVGGDFNLHTDEEPDASQFARLLAETGLTDVCAALACPQPGRIDKFLFRSGGDTTIEALSWRFETDIFVDDAGEPLSDHDPLAVRFRWTR